MTATSPDITFCLKRIGKDTAGGDTLVVTGAADTATPPENLWAAWTDLERWPSWSPLHRSVTGTPETGLAAGASFDQQISLGFPIGTTTEHATFDLLEPGRRGSLGKRPTPTASRTVTCGASPHCPTAGPASGTPKCSPAFRWRYCAR